MSIGNKKVLIAGGAGYVGAVLTMKLLSLGYRVTVVDLLFYGQNSLATHPNLEVIRGDINDYKLMEKCLNKQNFVINLATITDGSQIPALEKIRKSTNVDACKYLGLLAKSYNIEKFIYASSASVYGNSQESRVTETTALNLLSDYALFKAECENYLLSLSSDNFCVACVRPCTIFGYSPRQRFDLIVNYMIASGFLNKTIPIFGANKVRPNVHIQDITNFYALLLEAPATSIAGQIFNVAYNNYRIGEIALQIKEAIQLPIDIITKETTDERSYNVSSQKALQILGFKDKFTIQDGVSELVSKIKQQEFHDPLNNSQYFNRVKKDYNLR